MGKLTKSGSALVSRTAITGIFNFLASRIANLSLTASKTTKILGS